MRTSTPLALRLQYHARPEGVGGGGGGEADREVVKPLHEETCLAGTEDKDGPVE